MDNDNIAVEQKMIFQQNFLENHLLMKSLNFCHLSPDFTLIE